MKLRINTDESTKKRDIHLRIHLLGPFEVILDGKPVTGFSSNNVRALLAYLAVEANRPHSRQILASLLWPDCPDTVAADRFRNALSNLHRVLGGRKADSPFILSSRETVQFNPGSDSWVDATALSEALSAARAGQSDAVTLQRALNWVRGPFLHGLSIRHSPAFEEWELLHQERINRQIMDGLGWLAADCERQGKYSEAGDWVRRQLELEPLAENLHQKLMRLLALGGQRIAALDQYEVYRRLLSEELDIEPADETNALRERIRRGELEHGSTSTAVHVAAAPPPDTFVSRESELAKLDGFLDLALTGQGRVALVSGEAGSGKSALLRHFARRAMARHNDVIVAYGTCNAHSGIGDPYLPFREALQMLSADTESGPAGYVASPDLARRLWALLPVMLSALVEAGPDLIGRFIPADGLVLRAEAYVPYHTAWWPRFRELAKNQGRLSSSPQRVRGIEGSGQSQDALFEQVTRVVQTVSQQQPLVLMLDDLQWVDAGSASLLFHLGRRLTSKRVLIVGAYRPEVVAVATHDGHRHFLEPVANELQREFGDTRVDLDRTKTRAFVDALLDSQPNGLSQSFRGQLHQVTGGHALFTVELVRDMRESGDLVMDKSGRWMESPSLSWERLPPRVEAIIAERTESLPAELHTILNIAAVEGEEFVAEVVARVSGSQEKDIVQKLSGPLGRERGLVHPARVQHRPSTGSGQRLSRYRFRHALFQRYLHDHLDDMERSYLHEAVGQSLEELYGGDEAALIDLSPTLAWHFQSAGLTDKAIKYLIDAGRRASNMAAYQEAIALLSRGLDLLSTLPESPARDRQELDLRLAVVFSLNSRGWGSSEQVRMMERVRELCERVGETERWLEMLYLLCNIHQGRTESRQILELAKQMLDLARRVHNPIYSTLAHAFLGVGCFYLSELTAVDDHAEQAMACYRSALSHKSDGYRTGVAGSMLVCAQILKAVALWTLGYPDRAMHQVKQAREFALEGHHLPGRVLILSFQLILHYVRGERETIHLFPESIKPLIEEKDLPVFRLWIQMLEGLREIDQGQPQKGIVQMRRTMSDWQAQGTAAGLPLMYIMLAEACLRTGQPGDGLDALNTLLAILERHENLYWYSEMHRLRGELRLALADDMAQAEADFRLAIEIAQRQQAKSWELRATLSLARLWQRQSRRDEVREMLSAVYAWFTEGFDTPDLQAARQLLAEL